MIQAEVEYCKSQERAMIEECTRDKAEDDTESFMRDKAESIEISRGEAKAKARTEDDTTKQVWRAKSLGLRNSKNS